MSVYTGAWFHKMSIHTVHYYVSVNMNEDALLWKALRHLLIVQKEIYIQERKKNFRVCAYSHKVTLESHKKLIKVGSLVVGIGTWGRGSLLFFFLFWNNVNILLLNKIKCVTMFWIFFFFWVLTCILFSLFFRRFWLCLQYAVVHQVC